MFNKLLHSMALCGIMCTTGPAHSAKSTPEIPDHPVWDRISDYSVGGRPDFESVAKRRDYEKVSKRLDGDFDVMAAYAQELEMGKGDIKACQQAHQEALTLMSQTAKSDEPDMRALATATALLLYGREPCPDQDTFTLKGAGAFKQLHM